jgi:hypothetical protein
MNYQAQEYVLPLKGHAGREIEEDNKHGPTSVWGRHQSIGIEPICCQHDMHITSLIYFDTMFVIKALPCFTIGWMYHLIGTVLYTIFVSCHLFRGLFGHV